MTELAPGLAPSAETRASTRRRPGAILLPAAFVAVVAGLAAFGWLVAPYEANAQDLRAILLQPGGEHLLGTDDLGRDVFSRVIEGSRSAFVGPLLIALGAMAIGNVLGLLAGYRGGLVDALIMRGADLMYALPSLLVAIVVAGILGGGYYLAVAVLVVLFSPYDARIVRAATLEQRSLPYVEAARTLGLPSWRIMALHIWPNVLPIVVANTFLNFAFALVSLSALSFLGLGAGPAMPDWGRMLSDSRILLFDNPASALAPGAMLILTAVSVNLIGDWLYEWFSDRGRVR